MLQIIYSLRNYCLVQRANRTYQQLHNHERFIALIGSTVEQRMLLIERESERTENKAKLKQKHLFYWGYVKIYNPLIEHVYTQTGSNHSDHSYLYRSEINFRLNWNFWVFFICLFFFFYMTRLLNNSITDGGKYCLCLRVAIKTELYGIEAVYFSFNI